MKRTILALALFLLHGIVYGQCPQGDIILTTQQEVDDFAVNYPNCTSTNGSLEIGIYYGSAINNLNGLNQITSVAGDLGIYDNYSLNNLNGLDQLTSVGGDVSIGVNDLLDLNGLGQLTSIGSRLAIYDNRFLTSLDGLDQLTSIGGYLSISDNNSLTDLSGLNQVTSVGRVFITFNDAISNLDGLLPQLTSIFNLAIRNNDSLIDFSGMNHITSIEMDLEISNNNLLTTLDGLNQLTSIGRNLEISNNDLLTNLNGLNNLIDIDGSISIGNHAIINDITALENVDTITSLSIYDNPNLSFCGITSICNHIANAGYTVIDGTNAPGCNNQTEVLESCTLPIEMVNPLQIRLKNQMAILTWRTDTETNNSGFEIQRSKDGIDWQRIGWQAGQGTINISHSYTHIDKNPLTGTSYYRLKQVDFDGQFSYSNVVSLRYTRPQINIFPNPVNDKLYIYTNGYVVNNVLIFNTMGQQITIQLNNNSIDVSQLPAGLYTIKIGMGEQYFYEKIVIE